MIGAASTNTLNLICVLSFALALTALLFILMLYSVMHPRSGDGSQQMPVSRRVPAALSPVARTPTPAAPASPWAAPRLICLLGSLKGREFPIRPNGITLGRANGNSIMLDETLVSRQHARIFSRNGQFVLTDLKSTNGVYVNGQRIAGEQTLQNRDQIQVGESIFLFRWETAGDRPKPPSASGTLPADVSSPLPSSARAKSPQPSPTFGATKAAPSAAGLTTALRSYQFLEPIGEGGAATVYRGISLTDRAPVAIKVLKTTANPILFKKFIAEGKMGMSLMHPHIARIYNCGEEAGTYFIVMEYVDGGSLRKRMIPHTPCPLDLTITAVGQTCEALSYLHKKKVIHRDMKPENILLASHGGVKVVDFGIAKFTAATSKTADGIIMGTPYYMSYEQAAGNSVVPASDLYSLGVILYEMVTGEWPFTGDGLSVVHKHLTQTPTPPRRINPSIPPQVETVVMRALEKDVRKRYQDAMQLARDLGFESSASIAVSPIEPVRFPTLAPVEDNPQPVKRPAPVSPPPARMPRLTVLVNNHPVEEIALRQPVVILGRNEINPSDLQISRQPSLRILQQEGRFWIEDAGSRNGIFLNGQRIRQRTLLPAGSIIQIGNTLLLFEL